jgi:uncharacterized protein YkwD
MPTSLFCRLAFSAAILFVLSHTATSGAATGQKSQMSLSPENRAEVNRLLQQYRAAGNNLEKKREICQKVLAIEPAAVRLMLATVERELQPQLRKYSAKFQAQAAAAAQRKVGNVDMAKVMELRRTVHALRDTGDAFTKEVIVAKIDPAMQKLRAAFILDRSEVLDKSRSLSADRKKLEGLGRMWERCQAQMPPPPAADNQKKPETPSFENYLRGEEDLATLLAIPQDPRTHAVLAMNARLAENIDPEEAKAILSLNLTRNLLGLPALAIDLRLCEAARDNSNDMERLKFFSHESPVPGKKTFGDRAMLAGTTASAENIFMGSTSGKTADEAWFHSPGHHKNQMGSFSRIGVGRSGVYFTQMFGS